MRHQVTQQHHRSSLVSRSRCHGDQNRHILFYFVAFFPLFLSMILYSAEKVSDEFPLDSFFFMNISISVRCLMTPPSLCRCFFFPFTAHFHISTFIFGRPFAIVKATVSISLSDRRTCISFDFCCIIWSRKSLILVLLYIIFYKLYSGCYSTLFFFCFFFIAAFIQ